MTEYIDREAVLWDLHHLWDWDSVDGITASTVLKQVITDVKNVPAADVRENVKGKWEPRGGYYYCSQCGARYEWGGNFCPNCGADMRGKGDG